MGRIVRASEEADVVLRISVIMNDMNGPYKTLYKMSCNLQVAANDNACHK